VSLCGVVEGRENLGHHRIRVWIKLLLIRAMRGLKGWGESE
jgi:hypothetical protein